MTTQQVADRFMELINQGKNLEIHEELYADNVVCMEPAHSPNPLIKGKEASIESLKAWYEGVEEMHDSSRTEAIVSGNHFTFGLMADVTFKGAGRMKMEEICLYEVKDGKIVTAQYFY